MSLILQGLRFEIQIPIERFAAGGILFHIMAPACVRRLAEQAVLAGGTTSKLFKFGLLECELRARQQKGLK